MTNLLEHCFHFHFHLEFKVTNDTFHWRPLDDIVSEFVNNFSCYSNMGGEIPPNNWKGALNVSYRIGPGFTDEFKSQ